MDFQYDMRGWISKLTGPDHATNMYLIWMNKEKLHSTNIHAFYSQKEWENACTAERRRGASQRERGRIAGCLAKAATPLVGVCVLEKNHLESIPSQMANFIKQH